MRKKRKKEAEKECEGMKVPVKCRSLIKTKNTNTNNKNSMSGKFISDNKYRGGMRNKEKGEKESVLMGQGSSQMVFIRKKKKKIQTLTKKNSVI